MWIIYEIKPTLFKSLYPREGGNEISFSAFSDTQMAQDMNDDFTPNAAPSVPEKSQVPWMWDWEFSKKLSCTFFISINIIVISSWESQKLFLPFPIAKAVGLWNP